MIPACRACAAPIRWAVTPAGKAMPLDREPSANGTWICVDGKTRPAHDGEEGPMYTVHWATCPRADAFRAKRK